MLRREAHEPIPGRLSWYALVATLLVTLTLVSLALSQSAAGRIERLGRRVQWLERAGAQCDAPRIRMRR